MILTVYFVLNSIIAQGREHNIRKKAIDIVYTYIDRHAGTSKERQKHTIKL